MANPSRQGTGTGHPDDGAGCAKNIHSPVGTNSGADDPMEPNPMPAKAIRRHVAVSVAPKQMKAIDRDASKAGLSRRLFVQGITEDYLLAPTELIAGGSYRKADRVRLRFHLTDTLHRALTKHAAKRGVSIAVVVTTAIHNRYPA